MSHFATTIVDIPCLIFTFSGREKMKRGEGGSIVVYRSVFQTVWCLDMTRTIKVMEMMKLVHF